MPGNLGNKFVEATFQAGVPFKTVRLRCRNWGISETCAIQIADESSAEAYQRSLQGEFNDEAHFRAWVTRTAINVAVDLLRKQNRTVGIGWIGELAARAGNAEVNRELILRGIESLTQREQLILAMTYEEGLTLDEMVVRLFPDDVQSSANAKRLRVKRCRDAALITLRSYLLQHGFRDEGGQ